ncbi:MAG: transaldolase family protein [Eubacteriales bacterium]
MKIFLDTANINHIQRCIEYYEIDGVTTNPSIIAKEKKLFDPLLNKIAAILGDMKPLFIQVVATDFQGIIEDAKAIHQRIKGKVIVKIPVTVEGFKAIKYLNHNGIEVAATSIITSQQGLMAARCGAKYLIPYVNRVDNIMGDGINVVSELLQMIEVYDFNCKVIAASFKNLQQIHHCTLQGVHGVTIGADLLDNLVKHDLTQSSVKQFSEDWGKSFYNVKSIVEMDQKG